MARPVKTYQFRQALLPVSLVIPLNRPSPPVAKNGLTYAVCTVFGLHGGA